MPTNTTHTVRHTLIVLIAFAGGIVTTILASMLYAATSQSLADSLLSKIEEKVSTYSTAEKLTYFTSLHADIPAMIAALNAVDAKLVEKIDTIKSINDASSSTLGDLVDSAGSSNTNTNPGTTDPTNPVTSGNNTNNTPGTNPEFTVPNNGKDSVSLIIDFPGYIYCGDPSSSSITEDSSVTVGIYKLSGHGNFQDGNGRIRSNPNLYRSQCTKTNGQKKVWIECNGQKKLITDFDNLKNWDVLSCSANTVSQYVAGPTQTNTNSDTNTNTNSDIPDVPFITSSKDVTLNAKEIYTLQWNQVPGMEYYIAFDGGMATPPSIIGSSSVIAMSRFTTIGSHTVEIKACKIGAAKCSSRSIVHLTITDAGTRTIPCTGGGNSFNFSNSNQTNQCVGTMPLTGNRGDPAITVNATQGVGTVTVSCGITGWTVVAANCTRDKNATTVNQGTNTNNDIPDAPFITSYTGVTSTGVLLNTNEIYTLQWNQVPGMEYYIAFDGGMSVPPSIVGSSYRIPVSPRFAAGGPHTVEIKACKIGVAKCSSRSIVHLTIIGIKEVMINQGTNQAGVITSGINTSGTNTAGNITYKNCVSQYMKVAFPSVNLIYKNGGIRMGIASGTEFALPSGKHGESIVVKSQLNENGENLPEFVELHANYVCTDGEWKSQSDWKAISTDTRTIAQICSQNPDLQDCKCTIKPDPVTHIATFYWGSVGGVYKFQKSFTADQFGWDGVRLRETRGIYDDTGKSGVRLCCKLENEAPTFILLENPETVCE